MRILRVLTFIYFLGLLVFPVAYSKNYWKLIDETVASVNSEPVLYSDVKLYMLLFNNPSFKEALKKVIDIYAVAQYAEAQGLTIPQQKIDEIIQNFAKKQGLTVEQLYKMLEDKGLGGVVFQNFIYKYNLYVIAIQYFVIKPLLADKRKLQELIASYSSKATAYYTLEILKIPIEIAKKNTDLLATLDFKTISQTLKIKPIKLKTSLEVLSPKVASAVKRLKPGQADFIQEKGFIYLIKVLNIGYKVPELDKRKILAEIEEEKIKEFIKTIKENSFIEILDESPKVFLPVRN